MKRFGKFMAVVLTVVALFSFSSCGKDPKLEISDDGYWIIDGEKSDVKAKGDTGPQGPAGEKGDKGDPGNDGTYIPEKFTVSFNSLGGTPIPEQEIEFGNKVSKPVDPTRSGYTFDGWYVGDERWSFIGYSVTENVELTARWIPISYKLTYHNLPSAAFGVFSSTHEATYTIEGLSELYEPTSGIYHFVGWYADEELTDEVSAIPEGTLGDMHLYAKWENDGLNIVNLSDIEHTVMAYVGSDSGAYYYEIELYDVYHATSYLQLTYTDHEGNVSDLPAGSSLIITSNSYQVVVPQGTRGTLTISEIVVETITLKDLKMDIDSYVGETVCFEGIVVQSYMYSSYMEQYDAETGIYYGIDVYYGNTLASAGVEIMSTVGNKVRVIGTVVALGDGTYNIAEIRYNSIMPDPATDIQLISAGHTPSYEAMDADTLLNGKIELGSPVKSYDIGFLKDSSTVSLSGLKIKSVFTTNNGGASHGAMTITCTASDGTEICIRTVVLLDSDGNIITSDIFLVDSIIDVKGIVDTYNGSYQVKVFSINDVTFR